MQNSSLKDLSLYFLKLGTIGFGGPIALVGYMHRDLVEKRKWLTQEEYSKGLTLSQLAPGPLAAQLAIYIGYTRFRILGATLVALFFIAPSFLMVLGIGMLYVRFGGLPWMQALFYGIGAAVIGIIASSAYKLTRSTIKNKKLLWAIFAVMFTTTAYTRQENVLLFILSGLVALFVFAPPKRLFSSTLVAFSIGGSMLGISNTPVLLKLLLYFTEAGAFVFGSGLAVVPFLYSGVVLQNHWLNQKQFLDAVAVAMITPGPVVITVGFIGYLVAGFWGAVVTSIGVFLPVYLIVILLTPFYQKFAKNPQVGAFVEGVTAAATGAISGAVIVLGQQSIKDVFTVLVALGALIGLRKFKIPEPILIVLAGVLGLIFYHHN